MNDGRLGCWEVVRSGDRRKMVWSWCGGVVKELMEGVERIKLAFMLSLVYKKRKHI